MLSAEEYEEINRIVKVFDLKITIVALIIMVFGVVGGFYISRGINEPVITGIAVSIPFWATFWLYSQTIKYFKKLVEAECTVFSLEKELGITHSALKVLRSLQNLEKTERD